MVKFPEADARFYRNVFVCRKCKKKIRAQNMKVTAGKIVCKNCGSHNFRTARKK